MKCKYGTFPRNRTTSAVRLFLLQSYRPSAITAISENSPGSPPSGKHVVADCARVCLQRGLSIARHRVKGGSENCNLARCVVLHAGGYVQNVYCAKYLRRKFFSKRELLFKFFKR